MCAIAFQCCFSHINSTVKKFISEFGIMILDIHIKQPSKIGIASGKLLLDCVRIELEMVQKYLELCMNGNFMMNNDELNGGMHRLQCECAMNHYLPVSRIAYTFFLCTSKKYNSREISQI